MRSGPLAQLGDEAALARPGVAAEHDRSRRAVELRPTRSHNVPELIDSPDQGRGARVEGHACHHDGRDHQSPVSGAFRR